MNLKYEDHKIYAENEEKKIVAEVTFPEETPGWVNINHTYVDDSLRGQGVADKLLHAAADQLREQQKKAVPTCTYAVRWFEKHPEYADILK